MIDSSKRGIFGKIFKTTKLKECESFSTQTESLQSSSHSVLSSNTPLSAASFAPMSILKALNQQVSGKEKINIVICACNLVGQMMVYIN